MNKNKSIIKNLETERILEDLINLENSSTISLNDELLEAYLSVIKRKFYTEKEYFRTIFTHLSRKKRLNQGKKEGRGISKYKNIKSNISAEIIYSLLDIKKDSLTGYEKQLFDFNLIKLNKEKLKFLNMESYNPGVYSTWDIFKSHLIDYSELKLKENVKEKSLENNFEVSYNSLFSNVWHRLTKNVLGDEKYLRYLSKAQEKHQTAEERRAIGNDYIVHPYRVCYATCKDLEFILRTKNEIEHKTSLIQEIIDSTNNNKIIRHLKHSKRLFIKEIRSENYSILNNELEKHAAIIVSLTHDLGESWIKERDKKIEEIVKKYLFNDNIKKNYPSLVEEFKSQKIYNTNIVEVRNMARKDFNDEFGIVLAEMISAMTKGDDYKKYIDNMSKSVKLMSMGENLEYKAAWHQIDENKINLNEIKRLRKELRWIIPYEKIRDCIDNTERINGLSKSEYSKRLIRNIEVLNSIEDLLKNDSKLNPTLIRPTYEYLKELTIEEFKSYTEKFKENSSSNNLSNFTDKIAYLIGSTSMIYSSLKNEERFKENNYEKSKEEVNYSKPNLGEFLNNLESILDESIKKTVKIAHDKRFSDAMEDFNEERETLNLKIDNIKNKFEGEERLMADRLVEISKTYLLKSPASEMVPIEIDSRKIKDIYNAMIEIDSDKVYESVSIALMKKGIESFNGYKLESFERLTENIKDYMTILRMNKKIKIDSKLFKDYNNQLVDKIKEVRTHLYEEIEKGKEKFNSKIEMNQKMGYFDPIPREDIDSLNKGVIRIELYTKDLNSLRRVA